MRAPDAQPIIQDREEIAVVVHGENDRLAHGKMLLQTGPCGLVERQPDAERRALRSGREGQRAMVALNHSARDIEAETGAFADALRREERIEDATLNILWNAGTVVDHFHNQAVALPAGGDADRPASRHGVNGVRDQVGPHLVELTAEPVDAG